MKHTLEYASARAEIWRAYWRAWARPRGLWIYHVLLGLPPALLVGSDSGHFDLGQFAIVWAVATLACTTFLPLWPQIKFKAAVRSLTVDASGFRTTIGNLSGSRSWAEIDRIEDTGKDILIVGKNGNAMVVPQRAFQSPQERASFIRDVQKWLGNDAV